MDPDNPESPVLSRVQDNDTAVGGIAEADHLANGNLCITPLLELLPALVLEQSTDVRLSNLFSLFF